MELTCDTIYNLGLKEGRGGMMRVEEHADYGQEKKRLEETIHYVTEILDIVDDKEKRLQEEMKDAFLNLDSQDSSLSYSTIMLNTTFLNEIEQNHGALVKAKKKPYFARIDVKIPEKDHVEALYIGKVSVFDGSMENPLVVDWRAPIASLYYDGRIGSTSYLSNGVENQVDLSLKRNYTIEEGQLKDFVDLDISTSDTFLQASLEANAGEKLKDIVSTIQGEQNAIIRADIGSPLIVQGVAGSGKTTIALHRIAYLIYTYAKTFEPENFMIIAPNSLFLDYISQVLPELGAERVKQTTYVDFMMELIGKKYKMADANEKLRKIVSGDRAPELLEEKQIILKTAQFKNQMAMQKRLDCFIDEITSGLLPEEDFYIGKFKAYSKEDIQHMFYVDYVHMPIFKRIESIKKYLTKNTKDINKKRIKKAQEHYDGKLEAIRALQEPLEIRRVKTVPIIEERNAYIEALEKAGKEAVKAYMAKIEKKDLITYYREFMGQYQSLKKHDQAQLEDGIYRYIAEKTQELLAAKTLELEDLAPLVYLKKRLFGIDRNVEVKNVFIDEAQDFSNFQFFVLREVLNTNRFTILGDLAQGIHMYRSLEDWDYLRTEIFSVPVNYLTLEQSYRTTVEIMTKANEVLAQGPMENLIKARPVVRHGKEPDIVCFSESKELYAQLKNQIKQLLAEEMNTIAVITKTTKEAQQVYKQLSKEGSFSIGLFDDKVTKFNHKIAVVPSHLAKGLEFDGVIIVAEEDTYTREALDTKLMYVAMTRALHRMSIYYRQGTIPYFDEEN